MRKVSLRDINTFIPLLVGVLFVFLVSNVVKGIEPTSSVSDVPCEYIIKDDEFGDFKIDFSGEDPVITYNMDGVTMRLHQRPDATDFYVRNIFINSEYLKEKIKMEADYIFDMLGGCETCEDFKSVTKRDGRDLGFDDAFDLMTYICDERASFERNQISEGFYLNFQFNSVIQTFLRSINMIMIEPTGGITTKIQRRQRQKIGLACNNLRTFAKEHGDILSLARVDDVIKKVCDCLVITSDGQLVPVSDVNKKALRGEGRKADRKGEKTSRATRLFRNILQNTSKMNVLYLDAHGLLEEAHTLVNKGKYYAADDRCVKSVQKMTTFIENYNVLKLFNPDTCRSLERLCADHAIVRYAVCMDLKFNVDIANHIILKSDDINAINKACREYSKMYWELFDMLCNDEQIDMAVLDKADDGFNALLPKIEHEIGEFDLLLSLGSKYLSDDAIKRLSSIKSYSERLKNKILDQIRLKAEYNQRFDEIKDRLEVTRTLRLKLLAIKNEIAEQISERKAALSQDEKLSETTETVHTDQEISEKAAHASTYEEISAMTEVVTVPTRNKIKKKSRKSGLTSVVEMASREMSTSHENTMLVYVQKGKVTEQPKKMIASVHLEKVRGMSQMYEIFYINSEVRNRCLNFLRTHSTLEKYWNQWFEAAMQGSFTGRRLDNQKSRKPFYVDVKGLIHVDNDDYIRKARFGPICATGGLRIVFYVEKGTKMVGIMYVGEPFGVTHKNLVCIVIKEVKFIPALQDFVKEADYVDSKV